MRSPYFKLGKKTSKINFIKWKPSFWVVTERTQLGFQDYHYVQQFLLCHSHLLSGGRQQKVLLAFVNNFTTEDSLLKSGEWIKRCVDLSHTAFGFNINRYIGQLEENQHKSCDQNQWAVTANIFCLFLCFLCIKLPFGGSKNNQTQTLKQ